MNKKCKNEIADHLEIVTKSVEKGLVDARLLGFVERLLDGGWRLTPIGRKFVIETENDRRLIVRKQLEGIRIFKEIDEIVSRRPSMSIETIISTLLAERGKNLIPSTTQTIISCVLNWRSYSDEMVLF